MVLFGSGSDISWILDLSELRSKTMAQSHSGLGTNFLEPFGFGSFKLDP